MGLFSERKPYSAISSETETLLARGPDIDPSKLLNLIDLIQGSGSRQPGGQEAGRILRKRIKHGSPSDQIRAVALIETLVDNGVKTEPFIGLSGLGEQLTQLAASHAGHASVEITKSAKATRHCRVLLQEWSSRNDPNISRLFKHAGLVDKSEQRRDRNSFHPDDDLDDEVFGGSHSRGHQRTSSSRSANGLRNSALLDARSPRSPRSPRSHRRESSKSRSPSPVNLRGASLETTVATAHNIATRLNNALITSPGGSHETDVYQQQAKQLRHRIIKLVHNPSAEVQEYLGQLLSANEELVAALQAHDVVIDGHGMMEAQDDHDEISQGRSSYLAAPIKPVRPPPSPPSERSASPELIDVPAPVSNQRGHARSESFDPFADDNEQLERPKHTPMW